MADQFVMNVNEVWHIPSRQGPIVSGPIRSGVCRVGDPLELSDAQGTSTAVVLGIEFHVRPGEAGLLLGDLEGDLRQGQVVRVSKQ